jgi:hypothetical protein
VLASQKVLADPAGRNTSVNGLAGFVKERGISRKV